MQSEETKLINEIWEELEKFSDDNCNAKKFMQHYLGYINNQQLIESLLPLCKLLNRLFYQHNPALFDK